MINADNYTYKEKENSIELKAKKPNNKGFIVNISFSKDEKEHEESIEAIKEFFVREVL